MTTRYVVYGLRGGFLKEISPTAWREVEKPEQASSYTYDVARAIAMKFASEVRPASTRGLM